MGIVDLRQERDPVDPEATDVWVDGFVGDEAVRFRLDTGASTSRVATTPATSQLVSVSTSRPGDG